MLWKIDIHLYVHMDTITGVHKVSPTIWSYEIIVERFLQGSQRKKTPGGASGGECADRVLDVERERKFYHLRQT